jgi:hypothetical protein
VLAQTAALAIARARADEAKERQRKILNTATEAAEMATWRYTFDDCHVQMSPRAQKLYDIQSEIWTRDEAVITSMLHPDDRTRAHVQLQAAIDPKPLSGGIQGAQGGWGMALVERLGPRRVR